MIIDCFKNAEAKKCKEYIDDTFNTCLHIYSTSFTKFKPFFEMTDLNQLDIDMNPI